jgi:hypothetical protein
MEFNKMLNAAWKHVKPGGKFIATFRLTDGPGINDLNKSYQYINYEGKKEGEIAAYVVLNLSNLIQDLKSFNPSTISANGYWGQPSQTAVTPYRELCFAAFSIEKRHINNDSKINLRLDLPEDLIEKSHFSPL